MLICSKRETCRCGAAPEGLMAAIPPGLSVTSMHTPSLGRQRACIRTFAWNKAFVNYTGALLFWQADTGMQCLFQSRIPDATSVYGDVLLYRLVSTRSGYDLESHLQLQALPQHR